MILVVSVGVAAGVQNWFEYRELILVLVIEEWWPALYQDCISVLSVIAQRSGLELDREVSVWSA